MENINDSGKNEPTLTIKQKHFMYYFIILIIFIIVFICCIVLFIIFSAPKEIVYEANKIAIKNIKEILVKNNYCTDENDCSKKEFVLYEASFNTTYLNIYNNIDKTTRNEIKENIKQLKNKYQEVKFDLNFYEYPHINYTDIVRNKKHKITIDKFKI